MPLQPRPLEMVKSDTCLSDADKNCHEIEMSAGKAAVSGKAGGGILDAHDSTIHSGHFMVSHVHDVADSDSDSDEALPSLPSVKSPELVQGQKFGFDFESNEKGTASVYSFDRNTPDISSTSNLMEAGVSSPVEEISKPREVAIDASLSRLFECMTLAYSKLTSPRWKTFKGMKVNVKDKIRLNNIIWREWHMQYIKGNDPFICQFAAPLSDEGHTKPEAVVLEGKYWKRRLQVITSEYQDWRTFYRQRLKSKTDDSLDIEMTNAQLLDRLSTQETRRIPMQRSPTPAMLDEDFLMELAADNFFASLSSQPFPFPMSKDIGPLGNADFIQPGLFPLQPNIEDFMETMDAELGPLMTSASFVKSEPNLTAASMDFSTSPTPDKRVELFPASSLTSIDMAQIMPQSVTSMTSSSMNSPSLSRVQPRANKPATPPSHPITTMASRSVKQAQSLLTSNLQADHKPAATRRSVPRASPVQSSQPLIPPPQSRIETHNLQTRLLPAPTPTIHLSQVDKSMQGQFQTSTFGQTLNSVQLGGQSAIYAVGNTLGNASVIIQPSQLGNFISGKSVDLVSGSNNVNTVKLEPEISLPWTNLQGNQVIIPVRESNTIQQPLTAPVTTQSILVQQLLSKSNTVTANSNFAIPKVQQKAPKRVAKKTRNIAPAITTSPAMVTQSIASPNIQNTYLTQLLRRGVQATSASSSDQALQNPPNVEVNEFQKGLVMAAANKAAFGSIPFQSTNKSNFISQALASAGIASQASSFTTSGGLSIISPPRGMIRDPVDPNDSSPSSDLSASNSETSLFRPLQPKYEEREKYREHRRACHISAEQKRRSSIKNGFDLLHVIIPSIAKTHNAKISKAAMLQKTAEYLSQLKEEKVAMQVEEEQLRKEVETLTAEINACQAQLPASGVPVTRQREDQLKGAFDEYVRTRTMQNWKFWIFSTIFQDIFNSFISMVSTASADELSRTILAWLDQHCSLLALRPIAMNALCNLSKTTSILSDPSRVPHQAAEAVRRRDSDPGSSRR